jgi:CubicO group peptidase (beta-lactamase class C family)
LICEYATAQDAGSIAARHYEGLIRRGLLTGAAFAAVEHGQVTETAFFGQARPDSLWRAASTTKAFTAIGIMRLVERGQLDLDADVNRYLKTFRVPATKQHPVIVRHLLTHTSGLDDRFVGSGFLDSAGAQPPLAMVMRSWLPQRVYEPGEVDLYTNFGYGVLGALIEDVTGRRFEDYMRTEVLEPLGMRDSAFQ